jgi:hypothetical protein
MNKIIRALVAFAALALAVGINISPQVVQEASAADQYIWVCNDSGSDDNIRAYNTSVANYGNSTSGGVSINQGDCKSINDRSGNARVDVDPAGGEADIDSYRIYTDCYPFNCSRIIGDCHEGENSASNPDSSNVRTSHYVTSRYSGCL